MRKLSRFAILLGAISAMALAGCGENSSSYDPNNFIETGEKVVKDKITLKFFVPRHPLHHKDGWGEMKLFKKMEEATNIHIEWMYGSTSNYSELRSAAWEAKDRPDAFFCYNSLDEVSSLATNGAIHDLTDYVRDYMPNYNAIMDDHPEWKALEAVNGRIYSPLSINDVPRDQTFKQFINKKWLEELGLEMPTNVDEYKAVLTAFKNDDPNLNGIPDEVPLSSAKLNQTRNFLMSAFGYAATGLDRDANDNVVFVPSTDNYRHYLEYAHELYEAGLLDNNTFTMNQNDLAAKGDVLGSYDGAAAYLVSGMDKDADYDSIAPLTSQYNSQKMWLGFNSTVSPSLIVVPKSSPYVKEIVRWCDFLYSQKGIELQCFGEEGVDWQWNDQEKTSFHFNVPQGMSIEEFRGTITPGVGLGQVAYWDKNFVLKDDNEYVARINQEVDSAGYIENLKVPLPQLLLTASEKNSCAIIEADLEIYMETFEQKCITGKTVINNANWQAHLDSLSRIRYQDYVAAYQAAYERSKA